MNKNILISGSYGTGNVGDEVILERLLSLLEDGNVTVLSQGVDYTDRYFKGIKVIAQTPSWKLIRICKDIVKLRFNLLLARLRFLLALRSSDIFIVGGGGLFAELVPQVLEFYLHQIKWANFFGVKTIVFGVGVGPLLTDKGKLNLKNTFSKAVSGALVRDKQSLDNIVNLDTDVDVVECPDLAFLGVGDGPIDVGNSAQGKRVVINLYSVFSDSSIWQNAQARHDSFISTIKGVINYLLDKGFEVELLPFGTQGDLVFCRKLASSFNDKVEVFAGEDFKSIQSRFENSIFSITMRFHAGLLSFLHGTPSLCIDQQFKSERLLVDMNMEELLLSLPDGFHKEGSEDLVLEDVINSIENLLANRDRIQGTVRSYFAEKHELAKNLTEDFLTKHDVIGRVK